MSEPGDTRTDSPVIGIDLGTTYSCVAIFNRETQKAEVLRNKNGKSTMPSVIAYGETGDKAQIGEAAYGKSNFIRDSKRVIGQSYQDFAADKTLMRSLPFNVVKGKDEAAVIQPFKGMRKERILFEQVGAKILTELKGLADERTNEDVRDAVITVPANFNANQK